MTSCATKQDNLSAVLRQHAVLTFQGSQDVHPYNTSKIQTILHRCQRELLSVHLHLAKAAINMALIQ